MARLRYDRVTKAFSGGTLAMDDVSLAVEDGEFLVFLGPSGSGKSTYLRVMAGLEEPTRGRVLIDDVDVTDHEPRARDLAMVFQSYALYPHRTVRENLEFGLRMRGRPEPERAERVERIARALDIAALLERRPGSLSGGQRQRVALGRALVREPRAFLLDEPLSNLDPALRVQARTELARLHRSLSATFLYVTHDQEEAMTLGDRVAVLRDGRIQQVAPPMELYRRPANRFVAGFIGSPPMNLYPCRIVRSDGRAWVEAAGLSLDFDDPRPGAPPVGEALLGVRPQDVEILDPGDPRSDGTARVELVEPRGSDLLARLELDGGELAVVLPSEWPVRAGDTLAVRLGRERLHYFDRESGARLEP